MNSDLQHLQRSGIDPANIRIYCDLVFGYLDGFVPVRLLAESGTANQRPRLEFPRPEMIADRLSDIAKEAAVAHRAVFVVPGTVARAGSARTQDIVQTGVLLVDIDQGDIDAKCDHLAHHLGRPSLQVASGGITSDGQHKRHLYWRLTEAAEGEDLQFVARLRGMLAAKVEADRSFESLHQPIRVAGTIHGKHGRMSKVDVLGHDAVEYELGDLADRIDAMPTFPGTAPVPSSSGNRTGGLNAQALATIPIRENGIDGITRFDALSKVIGHWIRTIRQGNSTEEEAWQAVVDHNQARIEPPWNEVRLRREFDALLRRDIANHGPMPQSGPAVEDESGTSHSVPPDLSDDALAASFVEFEGEDWRHVPAWGRWYRWGGKRWANDETHLVRERMRRICRKAGASAKPNEARRVASDKTIAAALRLAASDPLVATSTGAWDAQPMLLNTPAGVIDLVTGELLPHGRGHLLTQSTAASPGSHCPMWLRFLDEITGGDHALQDYLRRLAGYLLTGSISEQIFAFIHGAGGNGKSVFLQTLVSVLGDYAATATLDTFMASSANRHLTELAGLRAARLVIVPETEAGRAWAEARIKSVTGGEKVRANYMYRDHFEFTPQFKLLVGGNHRPALNGVGEAMRRRLHLIPFNVTIPAERRDTDLSQKLLAEADGILGWMLEGCVEWQKTGLLPPAVVTQAAQDYFADEDLLGEWLDESCDVGPNLQATSIALYAVWSDWAEARGHPRGTQKSFGEALRQRGFGRCKVARVRGWNGLAPKRPGHSGEYER